MLPRIPLLPALAAAVAAALVVAPPGHAGDGSPFEPLPDGWTITRHVEVPADQCAAFGQKLGGEVLAASNTHFDVRGPIGGAVQVNRIRCADLASAAAVEASLRQIHRAPTAVLRDGTVLYELTRGDPRLVRLAGTALGLKPRRAVFRVEFDAAPVVSCDPMQWNRMFNLMLRANRAGAAPPELAATRDGFEFGSTLTLRVHGGAGEANAFEFEPPAASRSAAAAGGELLEVAFDDLPERHEVPYVRVAATVEVEGFATVPTDREAGPELVAATPAWPVDDPELRELAARITKGQDGAAARAEAILAWIAEGDAVRYGGDVVGSRYGTKKVLGQGFGHCWDLSDVFVTLARAADVPARQVYGWLRDREGHVWAEVLIDGEGWRQVDPSAGMGCDADYIPYLTSEDGHLGLVYLSMPTIRVLREER